MKVKYIEHSCFMVELQHVVLLFDYYKGNIPAIDKEKDIIVFASHSHEDHFNLDIFSEMRTYPNVKYVFSRDIKRKYNRKFFLRHGVEENQYDNITFIGADESIDIGSLCDNNVVYKINTIKSTDLGVAFCIEADGKNIYHGGDLNWWAWSEEPIEDQKYMEKMFKESMEKIDGYHFHVAFLPLDPRQKDEFYLGFNYFMKHTKTDKAFAMHFWGDSSVIDRLKQMDIAKEYSSRIAEIDEYK